VSYERWPRWAETTLLLTLGFLGLALFVAMAEPKWSGMDSSDVVALVAVVVSGALGLAGLLSSYITSGKDRAHAARMAIQDRRQARLETAYVELLKFAAGVGAWAQSLLPVVNGDPSDPARDAPKPPGHDDEWSITAKVAAFGSPEVRGALEDWRLALREVQMLVRRVQIRDQRDDPNWADPWAELDDRAKPAEKAARTRLEDLVSGELNELHVRST